MRAVRVVALWYTHWLVIRQDPSLGRSFPHPLRPPSLLAHESAVIILPVSILFMYMALYQLFTISLCVCCVIPQRFRVPVSSVSVLSALLSSTVTHRSSSPVESAAAAVPVMEVEDATSATSADVMGHGVASCVNDSVCSMQLLLWNRHRLVSIPDSWNIVFFCSNRLVSYCEPQERFSGRIRSTYAQSEPGVLRGPEVDPPQF